MDDPLAELDQIDWAGLRHAYGSAGDVPGLLRALASDDQSLRAEALGELYTNVFHQGNRFQATPYAVPFLVRLAVRPAVPDRDLILYLLAALALGYDEAHLPEGVGIAHWRAESAIVQSRSRPEAEDALDRWAADAVGDAERWDRDHVRRTYDHDRERAADDAQLASYDAVRAAVPRLLALLADADPSVRTSAAYVVSWFPEEAATVAPALAALARADPDPVSVATALFGLSLLPHDGDLSPDGPSRDDSPSQDGLSHPGGLARHDEVVAARLGDADELVRACAALSLVNLRGEAAVPEAGDEVRRLLTVTGPTPLPYGDGDLATLATRVSRRRLPADAPARASALIARLAGADGEHAFPIVGDLMDTVFDRPGAPAPHTLTALQRDALEAVAGLGDEAWSWLNLLEILRHWGVPDGREKLAAFLSR